MIHSRLLTLYRHYMIIMLTIMMTTISANANVILPSFSKVFSPDTIGPGSVSTLTFTITNGSGSPETDLAFTDVLPTPDGIMTIADAPNVKTTCQDAVITAPAGGGTISMSGAKIGATQSCTISVDVTADTLGVYTNTTGDLTGLNGNSGTATDDLTVVNTLPGFSKSFAPSSVNIGEISTLTFVIDNTSNASRIGNLDFTDNLPAGLVVAPVPNVFTDCISANSPNTTVTAVAGSSQIVLIADGSTYLPGYEVLSAGATCTVSVDVLATGLGQLQNITENLSSDSVVAGKASATLEVSAAQLVKTFLPNPVTPGSTTILQFSIINDDRLNPMTNISFTDDLTNVLTDLNATGLPASACGGSISGTNVLTFSGGSLPPEGRCDFNVTLSVPAGAAPGAYVNTTSPLSAERNGAFTGNIASAELFVSPMPILTKHFTNDPVGAGDTVTLEFTVTNTSATSGATDITFTDELTTFLPSPLSITLPPIPNPPCGGGSSVAITSLGVDGRGLLFTGGSLAPAGMAGDSCTFELNITIPTDMTNGDYTSATSPITATVDGATRIGLPAVDTLSIISAPQLIKAFGGSATQGDTVQLQFSLRHSLSAATDATDISFTDDLSAVLTDLNATGGLPAGTVCSGGTISASVNDTLLSLSGATLAPGEQCDFNITLNVPQSAPFGEHTNNTSQLAATVNGLTLVSPAATADLKVVGLKFSKEFRPNAPGQISDTLVYTIKNLSTQDATISLFTDNLNGVYPSLSANLPAAVNTCGGTPSGTTFLLYTGGSVLAGQSCTIEIPLNVPAGLIEGSYSSTSGPLSADIGGAVTIDPAVANFIYSSPLLVSKDFNVSTAEPGDVISMSLVFTNINTTTGLTDIDLSDDLGAALNGLNFTSIISDTCAGNVSGQGSDMLTVDSFSLAASASCTLEVALTIPPSATSGSLANITSSANAKLNGYDIKASAASASLNISNIADSLAFNKSFSSYVHPNGTVTLSFHIENLDTVLKSGIAFTDDLDSTLTGLEAVGLPKSNVCGNGSTLNGTSIISLSGGELTAISHCDFNVTLSVPNSAFSGIYTNTTSDLYLSGLYAAKQASANLNVVSIPNFSKIFNSDSIDLSDTSTLTFTINNSDNAFSTAGLAFQDDLPTGLSIASPSNASSTCNGGVLTADTGTTTIIYSGGNVNAGASCEISVDVVSNITGTFDNNSSVLTTEYGDSSTAFDTLTVTAAPGFSKEFSDDSIEVEEMTTLTFDINNTLSVFNTGGLSFTDNLPAGMSIAGTPNISSTCIGGTLTAIAGSTAITYSGGSVNANSSCSIAVDITSNTSGTYINTTSTLATSIGTGAAASDTIDVYSIPSFSKSFAPSNIGTNETSTLTFTINNNLNAFTTTALEFTDNLPSGLTIASPNNLVSTCTGGTLSASSGASMISYSSGSVAAGSSCTISVDLLANSGGVYDNNSSVLSTSYGNGSTAAATLTVQDVGVPTFTKAFSPEDIAYNGISTLTFTIDNSSNNLSVGSLAFTDNFPTDMIVATPTNVTNSCTGGTFSATAGASAVSYSGGEVAANSVCALSVDIESSASGAFENTSSILSTDAGSTASGADATINISDNDGLSDAIEMGPNQNDPNYDGDGSGTPDRLEGNVYSFPINGNANYVTVTTDGNTAITNVQEVLASSLPTPPNGVQFPIGLLDIDTTVDGSGHAVVEIYLEGNVTFNSYWKYTATPENTTPHWYEFMYDGTTGAIIEGNKITLHFQDGQRGDNDLIVNGQIDDQGGPAAVVSAITIPTLGEWGMILLGMLFMMLGIAKMQRREMPL